MGKHVWHYKDGKGELQEEAFTDAQQTNDALLLKKFESLEQAITRGEDIQKTAAADVEAVQHLAKDLPKNRQAHWLNEFYRTGIVKTAEQVKKEKEAEELKELALEEEVEKRVAARLAEANKGKK